jgi:thymidylate synthase
MNNYEMAYRGLLDKILKFGDLQETRTGAAMVLFDWQLKVMLQEGFPILTGRRMYFKNAYHEFRWMQQGHTNISYLKEHEVHIWNQWADADGELGPTYGFQIKKQWERCMMNLIKDPFGRRHVISLWQFDDLEKMALPPCYTELQFYVSNFNTLNLRVTFRSSDAAVGLPYDIAVLTLFMLQALSDTCHKYSAGRLTLNLTNVHVNEENIDPIRSYLRTPLTQLPSLHSEFNQLEAFGLSNPNIKMIIKP